MYGFSANGVTYGESLAVAKWNGTSVESQNDCTNAFKNALTSATPTKGLALRFYQDSTAGSFAGGYFDPVTIEVVTAVPEPSSSYAVLIMVGVGLMLLFRRRRTA
jgi:hypothetical protein